jgi:CBS domain-containing protein
MSLRDSLNHAVSKYMSTSFAQVASTESIVQAAKAMQRAGATEAIVTARDGPAGIVTERDILYKVVAAGSNPASVKVSEVMSSPVQTVDGDSSVADAIAKMSKLGIRRLGVTKEGKVVGLVTQKAMMSGGLRERVALPELAHPTKFSCPYCDQMMKSMEELSKHIDQVHLGLGLLEGDRTKW